MTDMSRIGDPSDLGRAVHITPLEIEDLSEVRYIHAAAFRLVASPYFTEEEIAAFTDTITSRDYTDSLVTAMRDRQLIGARYDNQLIGTAGWTYSEDQGETARLKWLYVRPLFTDCGIGRRLVAEVESRVIQGGFNQASVRSTSAAQGFFERLGYRTTSHGVYNLNPRIAMPVVFMRKSMTVLSSGLVTKH